MSFYKVKNRKSRSDEDINAAAWEHAKGYIDCKWEEEENKDITR